MSKLVKTYDDVFSYQERREIFARVLEHNYRMDGSDSYLNTTGTTDYQIFAQCTEQTIDYLKLYRNENMQDILREHNLLNKMIKQVRINVSHYGEKNRVHSDGKGITLLYYPNLNWQIDWGGHLMMLDEHLEEVEAVITFRSGRVVVFDGTIPHCIQNPTVLSPVHRFSVAIQYG